MTARCNPVRPMASVQLIETDGDNNMALIWLGLPTLHAMWNAVVPSTLEKGLAFFCSNNAIRSFRWYCTAVINGEIRLNFIDVRSANHCTMFVSPEMTASFNSCSLSMRREPTLG